MRGRELALAEQLVNAESPRPSPAESVIVQAGRRVDGTGAKTARFPSANVNVVRQRIRTKLLENKTVALVTSAACGTDLLALEVAEQMKIEAFILLPASPATFRASSVTDRPGNWGDLFDQVIKKAHTQVLTLSAGHQGYLETNTKLLDTAQRLANTYDVEARAMVVWNEESRGPNDVTAHFLEQARVRHLPVIQISTL